MAELRHLPVIKLGEGGWAKFSSTCPTGAVNRQHHDWDNNNNQAYRITVASLCNELQKEFPPLMDTAKISAGKLKDDKPVQEHYLTDVFTIYSGTDQTAGLGSLRGDSSRG